MTMEPFSLAFNAAVMTIANRLCPTGYDVSPDAPTSLEALTAHIQATGRIVVSSENSDATIYGDPEHNFAFRAFHDWCHWRYQLPFTLDGEREVCKRQQEIVRQVFGPGTATERFCALIECEVVGQAEYFEAYGHFPEDQRAFAEQWLNP
jgi:hypothetical protein